MRLDVARALMHPGETYSFEGTQAIAPQDINGDTVTFEDAVISGTYQTLEDGSVTVTGTLSTVAHGHCANCLADAEIQVSNEYRETFVHDGDPEDDEIFSYGSSVVDFEKLIMSYAMMALPIRLLCKPDCEGYLQYYQAPTASQEDVQHPFAALQDLFKDEEV